MLQLTVTLLGPQSTYSSLFVLYYCLYEILTACKYKHNKSLSPMGLNVTIKYKQTGSAYVSVYLPPHKGERDIGFHVGPVGYASIQTKF